LSQVEGGKEEIKEDKKSKGAKEADDYLSYSVIPCSVYLTGNGVMRITAILNAVLIEKTEFFQRR
jgi:hypothetical protein